MAEERKTLEEEIKRAKEAAERRRQRYIREKAAQIPENKPGDMLRWSVGNMPEANQNTFAVNPQFANTLYPETLPQKSYYTKEKSIYGEHTDEALDAISNILTAASLIPGIDSFADAAAIPVDLLRGDYVSAGLDALGILPFVGEVADTAKLARAGINLADAANDAGKVIDAVKVADKADDVSDVVKVTDDIKFPDVKYPGDDPSIPPGIGFEWRGKHPPSAGLGAWYDPKKRVSFHWDLKHSDPIGPHWDYVDENDNVFRVYKDGRIELSKIGGKKK